MMMTQIVRVFIRAIAALCLSRGTFSLNPDQTLTFLMFIFERHCISVATRRCIMQLDACLVVVCLVFVMLKFFLWVTFVVIHFY